MTIPFPCDSGLFDIQLEAVSTLNNILCTRCEHPLNQHEDARLSPPSAHGEWPFPSLQPSLFHAQGYLPPQVRSTAHFLQKKDPLLRPTPLKVRISFLPKRFLAPFNSRKLFVAVQEYRPSPVTATRDATVQELWQRLKEVRTVHVRGTPASGKSILARLLYEHVRKSQQDIEVFLVTWPVDFKGFLPCTQYYMLLNKLVGRPASPQRLGLQQRSCYNRRSSKFLSICQSLERLHQVS
jgi:hypothetical protein